MLLEIQKGIFRWSEQTTTKKMENQEQCNFCIVFTMNLCALGGAGGGAVTVKFSAFQIVATIFDSRGFQKTKFD